MSKSVHLKVEELPQRRKLPGRGGCRGVVAHKVGHDHGIAVEPPGVSDRELDRAARARAWPGLERGLTVEGEN